MTNTSQKRERTIRELYGEDYFRRIGRKGGLANVEKYGLEHFSALGKKGGSTTKERQSADYYSRIGLLGGGARWRRRSVLDGENEEANGS
jgi:hypothetical protein